MAETRSSRPAADPAEWESYISDFRRAGHNTVDWIADYLANVRKMPVLASTKPGELFDALPAEAPKEGETFESILSDFDRLVMPAVAQWNHPRFFAYFACTGSTPAILGEMLAAALNTNGLHWKTSPAVAELEQRTLDWLRQWLGLPEKPEPWFGIVYDTASTSSMHAIVCAREMVAPEARTEGSRGDLVLYTSDQSHSSIEKGAIAVGVGQNNIRKVPSDENFRMETSALSELIERDKAAGKRPFCMVATIGTTSSTSVDPLPKIAAIAEKHGMWLHVDAAYAGAAAMLPEYKDILAGVERAHSLVFNAHKWLLTPIDLSAFFTRRPDILRRAFSLTPEYLKTQEDPRAHNLMDYGVPLGHRFRALKLWFVLRYFGRNRIEAMLRQHIRWAQDFAALVKADPERRFEVVAPAPFSVVCFRYRGIDEQNRAIMERVNQSGRVFISGTVLNSQQVIRLAIGNLGTTWSDVEEAWELLKRAADEIR
ncbi:MAG TPA: aminotransferase class I/II-fold pyridoxal phosphate-dependent enzyme [Terriglobales bacterium]|nr:aminotransferase class I/II-fold pyridoxal phosphate-dependent enzyme [Terriglobales bacterium]